LLTKASAYAEKTCDRWYVLSAKHGLVRPDDMIEPYDLRLGAGTGGSAPIHAWAAKVRDQLAVELDGLENVLLIALAGERYRSALQGPWTYEIPMKGMGIGQQLGWLTKEIGSG
jgi:cytoplasmic iron level regulating protein YaaA (DUF328/UPF0246 family)